MGITFYKKAAVRFNKIYLLTLDNRQTFVSKKITHRPKIKKTTKLG